MNRSAQHVSFHAHCMPQPPQFDMLSLRTHEPLQQIAPVPHEVSSIFGGWVHVPVPLQTSVVQALLSEVQGVPCASFASRGQPTDVPVHVSGASHSDPGRHTWVLS